jgi:hypothetical protein
MAPKGAKDNYSTAHTRSDIGHRPNRGQWAVWKRAFRGETLSSHPVQEDETVRQLIAEHSLGRR